MTAAFQLAGHDLQGARDLGDLVHPVDRPPAVLALYQLQVVDHDQVQAPVQVQPPGLATDLDHALVRGVVDVYREFRL